MQFPQKDPRFAPLRWVQFYHISSMHTLGLVRVTVPTWPIQKSLKVRVFGDPGLRMFAWHVYTKRTNLSASSRHDLFNILKCPFEGHHKTSNGSIKEVHFEEAKESSRSHPIWPTLPSRGEWYELQLNPTDIIVTYFSQIQCLRGGAMLWTEKMKSSTKGEPSSLYRLYQICELQLCDGHRF